MFFRTQQYNTTINKEFYMDMKTIIDRMANQEPIDVLSTSMAEYIEQRSSEILSQLTTEKENGGTQPTNQN